MLRSFRPVHVVTMVVAVSLAAVLTPITVQAATGSAVNIVDKINVTSKARVTAKGTLFVNETDPITGALGRVDAAGNRTVTSSMANPTTPLDTINDLTLHSGDTRRPMFAGVGFRKISLTSLIASAEGATAGSVELLVIAYVKSNSTSGDCETLSGFGAAERFTVMVPVGQTVNLNWPSPLVWTQYADADDYYCIDVESFGGPTGYTAHFSAYGYRN
jgi:hypothetical protein